MVQHHVQNDRNAPIVARVDQRLERRFVSVGLVQRHVECRVVAPAVVSIELIDRHEFDGIDSQSVQIIQRIQDGLVVPFFGEVANQQFVNHQRRFVWTFEILVGPFKVRCTGLQN